MPRKAAPKPRPTHLAELCHLCGQVPVTAGMTHFACEHGSWDFADFVDDEQEPAAEPAE